ncbi:uncharacterized protein METZ01_LOCUS507961, partial [marine metagenome]
MNFIKEKRPTTLLLFAALIFTLGIEKQVHGQQIEEPVPAEQIEEPAPAEQIEEPA